MNKGSFILRKFDKSNFETIKPLEVNLLHVQYSVNLSFLHAYHDKKTIHKLRKVLFTETLSISPKRKEYKSRIPGELGVK